MKTILSAFIPLIFLFSCTNPEKPKETPAEESNHELIKEDTIQTKEIKEPQSASIKVFGECGVCKNRIEEATKRTTGVLSADWDEETNLLTITYSEGVNIDEIHKSIAAAGHDTEKEKACDLTYYSLPECCQTREPDGKGN